jgi:hypothetical protein
MTEGRSCPYCRAPVADADRRCGSCGRAIGADEEEIAEVAGRMTEGGGMDPARARQMASDLVMSRVIGPAALELAADHLEARSRVMELLIPHLEEHVDEVRAANRQLETLRRYLTPEEAREIESLVGSLTIDEFLRP